MLARLQKFIVLGLLGIVLLISAGASFVGYPYWGLAVAVALSVGYAGFLAIEFLMLYAVQRPVSPPTAQMAELMQAWWGEVLIGPRVFMWRQPFFSNAEPDSLPAQPLSCRGVVLVHGMVCNRAFWNPWMRDLRSRQMPFIAVNLEPLFGSIDHYADIIETAVTRMTTETGTPPIIVGHSMGGIAIRGWLRKFAADNRIHHAITIASPHQGTWLARFGHSENGKEMRIGSSWLMALAASEPSSRASRFTCFYGHCDNIVFPAARGMLPGAANIHVPRTAHVQMAFHHAPFEELLHWLGDADPRASIIDRSAQKTMSPGTRSSAPISPS